MAGYMGFGMQSWVYKMKPRKPFSMERKPSFYPLPKYERQFQLKPRSFAENKTLGLVITFLAILIVSLISVKFINKLNAHENEINGQTYSRIANEQQEAFDFLYNSGKNRIEANKLESAYSEFVLAHKIYPENMEVIDLLIETSYNLCNQNKVSYCDKLDYWLSIQ